MPAELVAYTVGADAAHPESVQQAPPPDPVVTGTAVRRGSGMTVLRSGVRGVFMRCVASRLELEGAVLDVEVPAQTLLQLIERGLAGARR